jgi:chromosome partitioning protein
MGMVVAFVSQKGGVGKSTLARALAREASAGKLSVKVADLDVQQGTLVNWQRRRLAAGCEPSVSVESFRSSGSALSARDGYDLLVLDVYCTTVMRQSAASFYAARFMVGCWSALT